VLVKRSLILETWVAKVRSAPSTPVRFFASADVDLAAIGLWDFTSLFGATKNVTPLKEAPNGLENA
jgi:hypothetical protein